MGSSWPRRAGFRYPRRDFLSASTRMTFLCVEADRKSTRLNSSHGYISYAVFCLKKKKLLQLEPDRISSSTRLPRYLSPLHTHALTPLPLSLSSRTASASVCKVISRTLHTHSALW